MQLTSILFPLGMLTSFIVASPLTRINSGESGTGVSKRTNFDALDKRDSLTLQGYVDSGCSGVYYEYSLDNLPYGTCWETISFSSAYVSSPNGQGAPYDVYVGSNIDCNGSHFPPAFLRAKSDICT